MPIHLHGELLLRFYSTPALQIIGLIWYILIHTEFAYIYLLSWNAYRSGIFVWVMRYWSYQFHKLGRKTYFIVFLVHFWSSSGASNRSLIVFVHFCRSYVEFTSIYYNIHGKASQNLNILWVIWNIFQLSGVDFSEFYSI